MQPTAPSRRVPEPPATDAAPPVRRRAALQAVPNLAVRPLAGHQRKPAALAKLPATDPALPVRSRTAPLYVGPRPRSTASAPRGGAQLSSERPGDSCSGGSERQRAWGLHSIPCGVSCTTRSARAAAAAECVTSTQRGALLAHLRGQQRRSRVAAVAGSRLPVGSSASTSAGRCTSARAIATRCSCAARERARQRAAEPGEADRVEHRATRAASGRRSSSSGSATFCADVQVRQHVEGLEHEAQVARGASARARLVVQRGDVCRRSSATVPASRRVQAGDAVEQRRLADARLAEDRDELAGRDVEVDTLRTPSRRRSAWPGRSMRSGHERQALAQSPAATQCVDDAQSGVERTRAAHARALRGHAAQPGELALGELARRGDAALAQRRASSPAASAGCHAWR